MPDAPIMMNVRPVPVAEWPKKSRERVLLWVKRHRAPGAWVIGHWFGPADVWVYSVFIDDGTVTHVSPLPPAPEGA